MKTIFYMLALFPTTTFAWTAEAFKEPLAQNIYQGRVVQSIDEEVKARICFRDNQMTTCQSEFSEYFSCKQGSDEFINYGVTCEE